MDAQDFALNQLDFEKQELLPAVVQDCDSGEVLMLAYMNREALQKTLDTGVTWFWSRSRKKYWQKGETSGNIQLVREIRYDCDADTLLIRVEQKGPACHTGKRSCFFNSLLPPAGGEDEKELLPWLSRVIRHRIQERPAESYVASLADGGTDRVLQKISEESAELLIAAKNGEKEKIIGESADLLFHFLVLLETLGIRSAQIVEELERRAERSMKRGG